MTAPPRRIGRRAALSGLALLGLPARRAAAQGPSEATLLVPGPEGGEAARWAARAAEALARGLPVALSPRVSILGGPDGVTAANRFGTLEAGDGGALLMLPGAALHARLCDPARARFEPAGWVPILAAWHGAVLAGRGPRPAGNLRVAIGTPEAPEAAALAVLDLLRVTARPVAEPAAAAFAAGTADAVLVTGPDPLAAAAAIGATPWLRFPNPGENGPAFPTAAGLSAADPQVQAVAAAVAAAQLRAAVVLPALTSANLVAAWRRAALRWQEEARADPAEGRALVGAEAAAAVAAAMPPPDAVLAWRTWLERRLGWRAG